MYTQPSVRGLFQLASPIILFGGDAKVQQVVHTLLATYKIAAVLVNLGCERALFIVSAESYPALFDLIAHLSFFIKALKCIVDLFPANYATHSINLGFKC